MRPFKLTIQAFGPFRNSECIDFTAFDDNSLFLINGPTGSGKTTLLDAICFALYGQTTGGEREASQMRSDHADSDQITEVDFTFALGKQHYHIRRQPDQERAKQRGSGTMKQTTRADFWRINSDDTETVITHRKVNDANQAIEELLGLNANQFRQVIVLPQGQFRQLLLANSRERENIFSRLFQTETFRRLEQRLQEQASALSQEADFLEKQRVMLLETNQLETHAALDSQLAQLTAELLDTQNTKKIQEQLSILAGKTHEQAISWHAADQHLKQCQNDYQTTLKELETLEKSFLAQQTELTSSIQEQQKHLITLENLQPRLEPLEATRQQHTALETKQDQYSNTLQEIDKQLTELTKKREKNEVKLTEFQQRQQQIPLLQLQQKELLQQVTQSQQIQTLQNRLHQQEQALASINKQVEQLDSDYQEQLTQQQQLELEWHLGQSILLAEQLQTGLPCPVCGNTEHPAPAHGEFTPPNENELNTARKLTTDLAEQLQSDKLRQGALENDCQHLRQQLTTLASNHAASPDELPQMQLKLKEFTQTIESLEQESSELNTFKQQLAKTIQVLTDLQTEQAETEEHFQTIQKQLHTTKASLIHLEQDIPEPWRISGALAIEIENTTNKLIAYQQELDKGEHHYRTQRDKTQKAKTVLDTAISSLSTSKSNYQQALQLLQQTSKTPDTSQKLSKPDLNTGVLSDELPDLAVWEDYANEMEQQILLIEQRIIDLSKRQHQLEQASKQLNDNHHKLQQLEEDYRVVGTLADVANGRNAQRLSLQRFVLSVLLDDVLLAASQRFYRMSKGRYELCRKTERGKGNRAAGLDLLVTDTYTGKERDVATLSGGESFMAALSLALGLSDVIQGYAGGIRLDTLFIDEGFGSLDEDSLDLAIQTLSELRDNGRMVGIISHVHELKEQIPQRIDIIPQINGSQIRLIS